MVVALQGDCLSVEVHHAPWAAVLQAIERLMGIEILVRGPLVGTLTYTFEGLPLEQGLRQLFRQANYVFFYAKGAKAEPGVARLSRVWLFPKEGRWAEEESLPPLRVEPAVIEPQQMAGASEVDAATDLTALRDALSDMNPIVRSSAVQAVAEQQGAGAIAVWRMALRDPDPAMRLRILARLAQHDESRALLTEALADEDDTVRAMAAFWLEQGALQHTGESEHTGPDNDSVSGYNRDRTSANRGSNKTSDTF